MDGYLDGSSEGYAGRIEVIEGRTGRRYRSEAERARIAGGISEGLPVPASASVETATAVLARGAPGLDPSAEVRAPLAPASARRVGAALVPTGRRENGREDSQE